MQIVQKIYIECQEMVDMKIKTGHFWFNGVKYEIKEGKIQPTDPNGLD